MSQINQISLYKNFISFVTKISRFIILITILAIISQHMQKQTSTQLEYLTRNGIKTLVDIQGDNDSKPHQNKDHSNSQTQFVLQVIGMQKNCDGDYKGYISDGFSKIQCTLSQNAKLKALTAQLQNLSVIIIKQNQIQLKVPPKLKDISSILKDCIVVKTKKILKPVGEALIYQQYLQNNFKNDNGSINIAKGFEHYTIRQIKTGGFKWCSFQAKVIIAPKSIGRGFLNFTVQDKENSKIQLVCFQEIATRVFTTIRLQKWYIIKDFLLQNNKKNNQLELKLIKLDSVTPCQNKQQKQTESKNTSKREEDFIQIPQNLKKLQPSWSFPVKSKVQSKSYYTIQQALKLAPTYEDNPCNFDVIGIIKDIAQKPNGRKLQISDGVNRPVELFLWPQITFPVQKYRPYIFRNLKMRNANSRPSFQSNRSTLIQLVLNFQKEKPIQKSTSSFRNQNKTKQYGNTSLKTLPNDAKVVTIKEMVEANPQKFQNSKIYSYCLCYIQVKMKSLQFGDKYNFFQLYCNNCSRFSEYKQSFDLQQNQNGQLFCKKCSGKQCSLKWNIKIKAVDTHSELVCSMQDQITQKFLQTKAKEGYRLFKKDVDKLFQMLQKLNYAYRVCKFMVKCVVKNQNLQKYYNILEIYQEGPTLKTIESNMAKIQSNIRRIKQLTEQSQKRKNQKKGKLQKVECN